MPGSSKWSLSLRFPHQNPVYTSLVPHTSYVLCPSHLSQLHFSYGYLISELCLLSTIPKNIHISAKDPVSEMFCLSKTPVTGQSQTLS
jgi:hypothetical protein